MNDKETTPGVVILAFNEGTGLGISLSYDIIIKGRGGDLKVETKEGEGSNFIIQLPTQ